MATRYFTDSNGDLPAAYAKEHDIRILHNTFRFEDGIELDATKITLPEFYKRLRAGEVSKTSQINVDVHEKEFSAALEAGDDVVYLAFSSALSGSCQSAVIARNNLLKKYPERKIYVIDTLCASLGEGLLTHKALALRDAGQDAESVVAWVEANKGNVCHWVMADDLHHLRRGGRVSATAAFAGTLLGIKPIIHVDAAGRLVPVDKIRGHKKALLHLVDRMEQTGFAPLQDQTVFISHSDTPENADYLAQLVKERFGVTELMIDYIGPVVGSHTGVGTVALFFMGSPR